MNRVKIISPLKVMNVYVLTTKMPIEVPGVRGCMGCLAKIGLLMFPFLILAMGFGFVSIEHWFALIFGLICLFIGGPWMYSVLKGGTYKPEKSFAKWRASKEAIARRNKTYGVVFVIVGTITLLFVGFKWQIIAGIIGTLAALYYMTVSFKVHEDVDFSVNNKVAEMLGFEIDEKIQCSYESAKEMLAVTNRRIFHAYENDGKRQLLTKRIDDLSGIGIYSDTLMGSIMSTEIGLVLRFTDGATLLFKMEMGEKPTSDLNLFLRKFLIVLDDCLLGRTAQSNSSRRRVTIDNESNNGKEREDAPVVKGRSIDVSESIIQTMKDAIPVTDNRNLEL